MSTSKSGEPQRSTPTAADASGGFDARLARLEALVSELEGGTLSLEASIERYREGAKLLATCRAELEGYRAQVQEIAQDLERSSAPYAKDPDFRGGSRG